MIDDGKGGRAHQNKMDARLSGITHPSTAQAPGRGMDYYKPAAGKWRERYEVPPDKRAKRDEEVKDRLRAMFGKQR